MIKGFDVEFNVVDAKSGEQINKTTYKKFFLNERVVVAENAAEAENLAIDILAKHLKEKGHIVQHGRKPYNGLLIDGDIRWVNFKVMRIPNSQVS